MLSEVRNSNSKRDPRRRGASLEGVRSCFCRGMGHPSWVPARRPKYGRYVKPLRGARGGPAAGRFQPARGARAGALEHPVCDERVLVLWPAGWGRTGACGTSGS
jgi:hypothetical protein